MISPLIHFSTGGYRMSRRLGISGSAMVALALIFGLSAHAGNAGKRLIELGSGERVWMTKEQVRSLALETKKLHKVGGFIDVTDYQNAKPSPVKTTLSFEDM